MDDIHPETSGLLFEVTDRVVVASVHASAIRGKRSPIVVAFDSIGSYLDSRPDEDHFLEFNYRDRDYVCSVTQRGPEE